MYLTGKPLYKVGFTALLFIFFMVGCSSDGAENDAAVSEDSNTIEEAAESEEHEEHEEHDSNSEVLALPELTAIEPNGERLNVVATTSLIGDVVLQVGGEMIELTTLIGTGQDSHSYEPSPQDLQAAADADVIFVNGWDLEEGLAHDLEEIGEGAAVVPISANIEPLVIEEDENREEHEEHGEDEEQEGEHEEHAEEGESHEHSGADPHVWFSIQNVEQWVENVTAVLSALDPANAELYQGNAAAYVAELAELEAYVDSQIAQLPEEKRLLVTNHDSFSYFTRDYHFEVVGTILPAASTAAEPSAGELADLIETMKAHGLCTIFTETSVGDSLAQTVAAELKQCEAVKVISLYTESIGAAGSGADSYIGMFRANVNAIVAGLQ